jgi:hypothetical protein
MAWLGFTFGTDVADLVVEVADDKMLEKRERKTGCTQRRTPR